MKSRIEFKIRLHAYKSLNGQSPSYLKELIVSHYPSRTLYYQNADLLVVPRDSTSRIGDRAFNSQAPLLWNHFPGWVQEVDTSPWLIVGIKPSYLMKPSYATIGPDCQDLPIMYQVPLSSSPSLPIRIHIPSNLVIKLTHCFDYYHYYY